MIPTSWARPICNSLVCWEVWDPLRERRAREGEAAGEAEGDDVAAKGDEDNGEVSSDASVTRFLREI